MKNIKSDNILAFNFILPALFLIIFIQIIPILSSLYISFIDLRVDNFTKFYSAPFIGIKNYLNIWSNDFPHSLFNIIIFCVIVIPCSMIIAIFVGIFLKNNFTYKPILIAIILIPYFTMDSVAYGIWKIIFSSENGIFNKFLFNIGIIDKPLAWLDGWNAGNRILIPVIIATIWKSWPFLSIILYRGLENISVELYEAARIDGVNKWQEFKFITFPILWPITRTLLILSIIWGFHSFNNFMILYSFGASIYIKNTTPSIIILTELLKFNYGLSSAMSIILLIIILSIVFILLLIKRRSKIESQI